MHPVLPLLQLLHLLKRVEGRKKLQKLVHILQELGHPFREHFEYSFYGMYSKQLRSELDSLAAENLIVQNESSGFGPQFIFEANEGVAALLKDIGAEMEPSWSPTAQRLNNLSAQLLEGISTILFLKHQGLEGQALKDRLLSLKPHLAELYNQCLQETESLLAEQPSLA